MESSFLVNQRLDGLEHSVEESYIDKVDALLLRFEQNGTQSKANIVSNMSKKELFSLKGLDRLENDLLSILRDAQTEAQVLAIKLTEGLQIISLHTTNEVGEAPFDNVADVEGEGRTQVDITNTRKRLQEIYDSLRDIMDTKIQAFRSVRRIFHLYSDKIVALGQDNRLRAASINAAAVVDPKMQIALDHSYFDISEESRLKRMVTKTLADLKFGGNDDLAAHALLLKAMKTSPPGSSHFELLMIKIGCGFTLLTWAFSECFNNFKIGREVWNDPTFAIFMCIGDLLLLLWLWGFCIHVWRSQGVDFISLLQLQGTALSRQKYPEIEVFSNAADLSIVLLLVFICFNKAARGVLSYPGSLAVAHALPVFMVAYFIYQAFFPFHKKRLWFTMAARAILAPFNTIQFRDSYIGDLLTSLVRVLISLSYSFAYMLMSAYAWFSNDLQAVSSTSDHWWQQSSFFRHFLVPFLTLFPLWVRCVQCLRKAADTGSRWPHHANALKYASAIAVISYSTFRPEIRRNPIWVVAFIGATLFQYIWDITMDWGLFASTASGRASKIFCFAGYGLRNTRLIGPIWIYIVVILANLFLRFAWALTLLHADKVKYSRSLYVFILDQLGPLIAAAEVSRRMIWGIFRVEYEQLEMLGVEAASASSLGTLASSHRDFQKMKTVTSMYGTGEGILDGLGFTLGSSSLRDNDEIDRGDDTESSTSGRRSLAEVLLSPIVPDSVWIAVAATLSIDITTYSQCRARLVEGVLFAVCVILVVLIAAWPLITGEAGEGVIR